MKILLLFINLFLFEISLYSQNDTLYHPNSNGSFTLEVFDVFGSKLEEIGIYSNQQLAYSGFFRMGEKHGTWTWWYENGHVKQLIQVENGTLNGLAQTFYESGNQSSEGNYCTGVECGKWLYWFDDGHTLRMEIETIKGEKHGGYQTWNENGDLIVSGGYNRGQKNGAWVFYDDLGIKIRHEEYKNGDLISIAEY